MAPRITSDILKKLRAVMKNTNYVSQSLQAYIIPYCDVHQNEYIGSCDQRIAFVSGFTGSRGTAIVSERCAALWTDGRYFLQAEQEMDDNWILMKEGVADVPTSSKFLGETLPVNSRVGVDPFLISYDEWTTMSHELKAKGHNLVPVEQNLIDIIWEDKPDRPLNEVDCIQVEYTGKSWEDKVLDVRKAMSKEHVSAVVITALDEIAWLFNLRGSDIEYNPVFFSYSIVTSDSVFLFIDDIARMTATAKASLESLNNMNLKIFPYESITSTLQILLNEKKEDKILISGTSSYALVSGIPSKQRLLQTTPIPLSKAIKNKQELSCAKNAHIKDSVALCEFFCWLSQEVSKGNVTEVGAADKLESFRNMQDNFVGPSFETISGSGPNGAIIHYKPSKETDRKITTEEIYLCDSGAQYRDGGTTDVTRTVHFGTPSAFEKTCYTLVLKGHIAVSSAIFPQDIKGNRLDSFARKALWENGLDYRHGTGHGVGAFLNVHEGPMGIHYTPRNNSVGLQPGMILSIEPGFYLDGQFGIRLENLAFVKETKTPHNFGNTGFLTFEPLTLVPFQAKLIEPSLLTEKEVKWLDNYHVTCQEVIGKALEKQGKKEALRWLLNETLPLG